MLQNEHPRYRPKLLPLLKFEKDLEYEIDHSHDTAVVLVDVVFYIIIQLLNLVRNDTSRETRSQPLSPSIRMELSKLDQIQKEYLLLAENHIRSNFRSQEVARSRKGRTLILISNKSDDKIIVQNAFFLY
ncbi:MAG: hypothetical protein PHH84_06120 [Oscillospiraceae bacterium]|nr:hypothetical protein [Oscillospiraceae bacterium]